MKTYRRPGCAAIVVFVWLASGIALVSVLGAAGSVNVDRIYMGVFALTTLAMARSVHVLMDDEEKSLPKRALLVIALVGAIIALVIMTGRGGG